MNACELLSETAARMPEHPALVFEGARFTYGALWARAGEVAARLRAAGVAAGDRVGLLLPNVPAFPVAFYGALRLGAVAVPLNPALTAEELDFMLAEAGVAVVVTVPAVADGLDAALRARAALVVLGADGAGPADAGAAEAGAAEAGPADAGPAPAVAAVDGDRPAVIVFSSGTTGRPKGVTLSHHNVVSNVRVNAAEVGMTAADRVALFMPLFHCYGLNVILNSALSVGATVALERRFDPRGTAETIARERVTMFFGVPTTFIVLLQHEVGEALRSLRYCYCAAAPLPREIEDRWRAATGVIVNQAYGLSEASPSVAYNAVGEYRPGSIGRPHAGVEVRVVDPERGVEVPVGAVGELWVRGPGVMLGYWGQPAATAAALRDGWLRTGDLGRRDADGYLFITDRLKDMINCGGMKVYPAEVEGVLYRHPAVGEAAVVGVPDETMGEVVHAQVAPRRGATVDVGALRAFVAEHLAGYKRPTLIRVVEALPKGRTGKILRRAVRERERALIAEAAAAAPARRWTRQALRDWIVGWLRSELADGGRVAPDRAFVDAGVDSLLAVRKAEALSALLGRSVPATVTWLYPTPDALAAYLVDGAAPAERAAAAAVTAPVGEVSPAAIARLSDAEARAALLAELEELGV
ncbi:MAG: AMP-binding protein [Myxococcales bacterium]|nr:AMP-binding protein [Myxococcales bacterium]